MASVSFFKMALLVCAAGLVLMALAGPKAEANRSNDRPAPGDQIPDNAEVDQTVLDRIDIVAERISEHDPLPVPVKRPDFANAPAKALK